MTVLQLKAEAKTYDWGAVGSKSKVAQYALASPPFTIDESTPYAELWMGTHPSGPSKLLRSGQDLKEFIHQHPDVLGSAVRDHFGDDLPFLFKVLAIGKALSIQAHPDKTLAAQLHQDHPEIYKDDNHKPEMAVAITAFQAFCGFLPPATISGFLAIVPELSSLVSSPVAKSFIATVSEPASQTDNDPIKKAIRDVFSALMRAPASKVLGAISSIKSRYLSGGATPEEEHIKDLFLTLDNQFPNDVGTLCVFLLNIVTLEGGQAVFLKANEPHAYISGDIIETMATSDNVVRAGLTPKLRDVDTLVSMLTYSYRPAKEQLLVPTPFRQTRHTKLYDPPIEEFSVLLTNLEPGQEEEHEGIAGPSILIATEGSGALTSDGLEDGQVKVGPGDVFFVGANNRVTFKADNSGNFIVFRAFVEVDVV